MSASHRLAALALAGLLLAPVTARATDDGVSAVSSGPTLLALCDGEEAPLKPDTCKEANLDALPGQIEKELRPALARAPVNARPLLKRDQVWFNEMIVSAAEYVMESGADDEREAFVTKLRQRIATLQEIAAGFGRAGIAGRWVNAFGNLALTPADGGAYRIAIDINTVYGTDDNLKRTCRASALLSAAPDGWLRGRIVADGTPASGAANDAAASTSAKWPLLRIRRQGETLRAVVTDNRDYNDPKIPGCDFTGQITASYFAGGKADAQAASGAADAVFVAPSFDCAHPSTATDEEICADPALADNDRRLNRAWKALLPRLDPTTRRALIEDQRGYVHAQAAQHIEFLHPAWNKTSYEIHFTENARYEVDRMQRERIALLEGFDENRGGFEGVWLAHNAILKVTAAADGSLEAKGWKWDQGDWKAGCDYEMTGKVVGGAFRSDDKGTNPDTLERDRATLIVNRKDDYFAERRGEASRSGEADEAKCKRLLSASSTARLFPARASPDINNFDDIR